MAAPGPPLARRCGREAGGGRRGAQGRRREGAQQRACAAELSNQGRPRRHRGRVGAQPSAAPRRGARRGRRPDGPGLPSGCPAPRAAQRCAPEPRAPDPRARCRQRRGPVPAQPGPPAPRAPRPGPAALAGRPDGVRPGARGPRPPRMGKSNSKLKPEVVEELTRKTYCECARRDPRPALPGASPAPSRPSPNARGPAPAPTPASAALDVAARPRPSPTLAPPRAPRKARGRAPSPAPGPIVLGHPPPPRAPGTCAACQCAPGHPRPEGEASAHPRPLPCRAVRKGRAVPGRGAVGRGGGAWWRGGSDSAAQRTGTGSSGRVIHASRCRRHCCCSCRRRRCRCCEVGLSPPPRPDRVCVWRGGDGETCQGACGRGSGGGEGSWAPWWLQDLQAEFSSGPLSPPPFCLYQPDREMGLCSPG